MWKFWVYLGTFYMAFGLFMIWTASRHLDDKLNSKLTPRERILRLYHFVGP